MKKSKELTPAQTLRRLQKMEKINKGLHTCERATGILSSLAAVGGLVAMLTPHGRAVKILGKVACASGLVSAMSGLGQVAVRRAAVRTLTRTLTRTTHRSKMRKKASKSPTPVEA